MSVYNKLVRDKIPEIIGNRAKVRVLTDEEYLPALDKKLIEECNEYQKDKSIEELADIVEVVYAIARARGYSLNDLEVMRKLKVDTRGGFDEHYFLESVNEDV